LSVPKSAVECDGSIVKESDSATILILWQQGPIRLVRCPILWRRGWIRRPQAQFDYDGRRFGGNEYVSVMSCVLSHVHLASNQTLPA
jgi:hypothetical protein